jgi:hypothetical protein
VLEGLSKYVHNGEYGGCYVAQGKSSWFNKPWEAKKVDIKHLVYVPPRRTTMGKDGGCEVLQYDVSK